MAIVIKSERRTVVDMALGDIPEGETFTADMEEESWLYFKVGGNVIGLHSPPLLWMSTGTIFRNYRPVDIEITVK